MEKSKILVPIDFQDQSINNLEFAVMIAKSINAKISCLHVIEEPEYVSGINISREEKAKIRREAEIKLADASNKVLKNQKIPFEIIVTKGAVCEKISQISEDLKVSFIVMGRSGSPDFKKKVTGSNTNHIIANSNIPVITVRNNKYLSHNHILLPLDLTKPVQGKVLKAIEIADALNARITLLAVYQRTWVSVKSEFQYKLNKTQQIFEYENLACNSELIETSLPYDTVIIKYAQQINPNMIFLMTQKEASSTKHLIGSTAQSIINKSEFPVLSVIPSIGNKNQLPDNFIKVLTDPIQLFSIN